MIPDLNLINERVHGVSELCCIHLKTSGHTCKRQCWEGQHTHNFTFLCTIWNKGHVISFLSVNVATETALFSRIFTACSLEIFVPGALSLSLFLSLFLWLVSQHVHTLFFPPLEKVNHGRWLWIWQKHKQPARGATCSSSLCRIYSRAKWAMKSHVKNFSFAGEEHQLHPAPHTHPLSSSTGLQTSTSTTTFESELTPARSYVIIW